jgi:hypothetical protein
LQLKKAKAFYKPDDDNPKGHSHRLVINSDSEENEPTITSLKTKKEALILKII